MSHDRMRKDLDDTAVAGALRAEFHAGRFDVAVITLADKTGIAPGRVAASLERMRAAGDLTPGRTQTLSPVRLRACVRARVQFALNKLWEKEQ